MVDVVFWVVEGDKADMIIDGEADTIDLVVLVLLVTRAFPLSWSATFDAAVLILMLICLSSPSILFAASPGNGNGS